MTARDGWLVATQHDNCARCDELADQAIDFATVTGSLSAETADGQHLANVERGIQ